MLVCRWLDFLDVGTQPDCDGEGVFGAGLDEAACDFELAFDLDPLADAFEGFDVCDEWVWLCGFEADFEHLGASGGDGAFGVLEGEVV